MRHCLPALHLTGLDLHRWKVVTGLKHILPASRMRAETQTEYQNERNIHFMMQLWMVHQLWCIECQGGKKSGLAFRQNFPHLYYSLISLRMKAVNQISSTIHFTQKKHWLEYRKNEKGKSFSTAKIKVLRGSETSSYQSASPGDIE